MPGLSDNFVLNFVMNFNQYIEGLRKYSDIMQDFVSRAKNPGEKAFFTEMQRIGNKLIEDTKDPGGPLYREFSTVIQHILSNIRQRWSLEFKEQTGRYYNALLQSAFIANPGQDGMFSAGIGDREALDAATSIYIKDSGDPYVPPQDYGGITGYWEFQEFTGAGPREVFNEPGGFWDLLLHGTGGFKRRNIMLQSNFELFDDDLQKWNTLVNALTHAISNVIQGRR